MYPCPYCHSQLTWVPQYNQYYCYFCHRYVQAAAPPHAGYYPQQPSPLPAPPQAYAPPTAAPFNPTAPTVNSPRPVRVNAQSGAPANAATPVVPDSPSKTATAEAGPSTPAPAKPSIEYVSKDGTHPPAQVPVASQPARGEPIYLCKICGTRLVVNGQRWFCSRCQQYK